MSGSASERVAYVNGEFVAESEARISIFDRGFLFGDAVYEVAAVVRGRLLDDDLHLARLERSLNAIAIDNPMTSDAWSAMLRALVVKNGIEEGLVYLQVSRGVAERDFAFPVNVVPTVVAYARHKKFVDDPNAAGVRVITVPDIRWARRDIKSTSMLAQVLAKQQARAAGAFEAFMHEGGVVTEGGSSNVYIVKDGCIVTRSLSHAILSGITRQVIFDLVRANRMRLDERAFTLDELHAADEAFLTSATTFVLPVIEVDGRAIGSGKAGAVAVELRRRYVERAVGADR